MPRRAAYAVVSLAAALALSGCRAQGPLEDPGGSPSVRSTVTLNDAQVTYSPLLSDLAREISATTSHPAPRVDQETIYYDDDLESCAYTGRLTFDDVVFGSDVSWDDIRATTQDIVAAEGFDLTGQLDIPGGYNGFDAAADDGATIQVRSKTGDPSTVSILAPVVATSPCPNFNQTLEPLDQ